MKLKFRQTTIILYFTTTNSFSERATIKTDKFDVLYYAQFDIKEAMIPAQVSVIKPRSFNCHRCLKSVKFSPNSELKRIEDFAFTESSSECRKDRRLRILRYSESEQSRSLSRQQVFQADRR